MSDDDLEEQELEPTLDDELEAARQGVHIARPTHVGPVIGSQRVVRADVPSPPPVRAVSRCSCGRLATGWHAGHELDPVPLDPGAWDAVGSDYHEQLADAMRASRNHKWLEWGPDEWRPIPEFPSYEMNGYDRHVRRRAYSRTLKSGAVKAYDSRSVTARRSSVTLSEGGVAVTRGIEKLWKLTFPEYVIDPNSWNVHTLRNENIPAELGRVIQNHR